MLIGLNAELRRILPDASLKPVRLPACNDLALFLIDPDYSLDGLDASAVSRVMDNPLYWMFCWASGKAMAQKIIQQPALVSNKTILDVGAGSGVVAIAAAKAGAKRVIASDIDVMAQQAIALNADYNRVAIDIIGDYREFKGDLDMIMVADVLYDRQNIPLLDALLKRAPQLLLADARVKNFTYPGLRWVENLPGETWPPLGGFDEFYEVNIFESE